MTAYVPTSEQIDAAARIIHECFDDPCGVSRNIAAAVFALVPAPPPCPTCAKVRAILAGQSLCTEDELNDLDAIADLFDGSET